MPRLQENSTHHPHDKGYKELLANKATFLELLKTFVEETWTEDIREDDLTRVEKSYILQDFNEKESDIVYQLHGKEEDMVFYVLLELQSTVDYGMPFRLLLYMVEIWRDIYNNTAVEERERQGFRLPVIIPAVLYNGEGNWTAAQEFRAMLNNVTTYAEHVVNFKYILFDVNRYPEDMLIGASNLIASIFALDQKMSSEALVKRLRKMVDNLRNLKNEEFRQLVIWIKHVLKGRLAEPLTQEVDEILDGANPKEVEMMIYNLERTLDEMEQKAEFRGMLKGREEGREEGKLQTAKAALEKGLAVELIAEITGLPLEEILKLQSEIRQKA